MKSLSNKLPNTHTLDRLPALLSVGQHVEGLILPRAGGKVNWYVCFGEW